MLCIGRDQNIGVYVAIEVEIKLAFKAGLMCSQIHDLEQVLRGLECGAAYSKKQLQNAYFDTPDFSLHQHKVALRIRQFLNGQGEPVYIQTFKTAGQSVNGLSQRGEWEWYLSQNTLDLLLLKQCEGWPAQLNTENLVTVFETNFERFIFELQWGNSVIELVLDWGAIISNQHQEKIHEIELELKNGHQSDLTSLAQLLLEKLPIETSDISKAERGVNLFRASLT